MPGSNVVVHLAQPPDRVYVADPDAGAHATVIFSAGSLMSDETRVSLFMRRDMAEKLYVLLGAALWPHDPDSDLGEVMPLTRLLDKLADPEDTA